jgi:hypothetical protein
MVLGLAASLLLLYSSVEWLPLLAVGSVLSIYAAHEDCVWWGLLLQGCAGALVGIVTRVARLHTRTSGWWPFAMTPFRGDSMVDYSCACVGVFLYALVYRQQLLEPVGYDPWFSADVGRPAALILTGVVMTFAGWIRKAWQIQSRPVAAYESVMIFCLLGALTLLDALAWPTNQSGRLGVAVSGAIVFVLYIFAKRC